MANVFVNFLLSLVMSKKARQNLDTYRKTSKAMNAIKAKGGHGPAEGGAQAITSREQAIEAMKAGGQGLVTEDRAELIKRAMEIRKAKQTLLANLDDDQRQKLMALALKALINQDAPPKE